MRNIPIQAKLLTTIFTAIIISSIILTIQSIQTIQNITNKNILQYEEQVINSKKESLKNYVSMAKGILQTYRDNVTPLTTQAELKIIKNNAVQAMDAMTYGDNHGYIFVWSYEGVPLAFHPRPELIGKKLLNLKGGNGKSVIKDHIENAKKGGGHFYLYKWKTTKDSQYQTKLSYSFGVQDWGWFVGTGEYMAKEEAQIKAKKQILLASTSKLIQSNIINTLALLFIIGILFYIIVRKMIIQPIKKLEKGLDDFFNFSLHKSTIINRIEIKSSDEFGKMSQSINENIDVNLKLQQKINNLNNNLELNITKRTKELRSSNMEFELMINNIMEGVGIFENGLLIDLNDEALDIFGYSKMDELIGVSPLAFIAPESHDKAIEVIKQNSSEPYEAIGIQKDGSKISLLIKGFTIETEFRTIRVVSVIDLTQSKYSEKQLEIAKDKAEQATKSKSEFLANMSHEIRTPINGIIGMAHLMEKTKLSDKQIHYIETINISSSSLLSIINDILDFSKIEAGKLEIDKIDFSLKDMVNNIVNIIEFKAKEKSLDFKINYDEMIPDNLYGDNHRISQVLINLLNNAVKFTKSGFVEINITNKDDIFRFEIIDSGIGMTKIQQERLFQSFSQADATTTRKYGGSGLGLSISKQLVKLMGGKIWVESQKDIGSTFGFLLALPQAKTNIIIENKSKTLTEDLQTLEGSKILLVEDNQINQEIVLGLLEHSGLIIDIANNGKEGVELFNNNNYELILMDMQMPIMDGIEATEIIRQINTKVPIIALTANAMKEDIERTQNAGMNEHLSKPIEVEALFSTLLKYISKKVEISNQIIEQKEDIEIPTFTNIDTKIGLSHMADNKKLYLKILNDFYTNNKDLKLENLGDKELERATHTIKGLSANIGATSLSKIAQELEETLNKDLFTKFYEELNIVLDELKDLNTEVKQINNLEISDTKRDELFTSLKEFATKRRAKGCRDMIEELGKYILSSEYKDKLDKIDKLLNSRSYQEIIEII